MCDTVCLAPLLGRAGSGAKVITGPKFSGKAKEPFLNTVFVLENTLALKLKAKMGFVAWLRFSSFLKLPAWGSVYIK